MTNNANLQKMIAKIRFTINDLETDGRQLRALLIYNYRKANPITADGQYSFHLYNAYCDQYRKNRNDLATYVDLMKNLKQQLRESNSRYSITIAGCGKMPEFLKKQA